MAAGWQFAGVCHASADLAAAHVCSQTFAVWAGGVDTGQVLSCTGYTVDGDNVELMLSTGSPSTVHLQPCDRMTYSDTWGPLFVAIALMLLAIWCAKLLINMFMSGSDHV
ncbi:hypothetical protein [Polaromonas sp.]|uniref:hypothetical protein n=1 Tax=Polaromonas sp. TaxID=1869339 RepID=UPI003CAA781C